MGASILVHGESAIARCILSSAAMTSYGTGNDDPNSALSRAFQSAKRSGGT